jgi:hypothetical protein
MLASQVLYHLSHSTSPRIKDLNIRCETMILSQEKIRNKLDHIFIGNNSMNGTPITQQLRKCIDKWDYMKL